MGIIKIKVPVSTSNLGPGFDSLGLALDWSITAEAEKSEQGLRIDLEYDGKPEWQGPMKDMVKEAMEAVAERAGKPLPDMKLSIKGDVPLARGLGSSASYRMAAAAAANEVMGGGLERTDIMSIVCRLEDHTDNAVPCALGGLNVSGWDGDRVRYLRRPVAERFRFVAVCPDLELATSEARKILPATVPRADAVFNMQRALWLMFALVHDSPEELKGAFEDRLHQPYRQKLLPFLSDVIGAAETAGAYGGFLSGAGSSIISVSDEASSATVMDAMLEAVRSHGTGAKGRVLRPDNEGLVVKG